MTLAVIGAGLGRTGTMSLKLALERLGFGPCYHMKEVFEQLDEHVPIWTQAASGRGVDWNVLFEKFEAAVDHPAAAFYGELADHYPGAKVILTVRDPILWLRSFRETIRRPLTEPLPDHLTDWGLMCDKVILDRVFGGSVAEEAHMIACYARHNEEVKRTIPPERLLVFEVAQGWEPLCRFLGVSAPDEPFPKTNTTDEFRGRFAPMFRRESAGRSASDPS